MTDGLERLTQALADRYRIERQLGAGGMATVYLAEDLKHKRKVAVKVLKPELAVVLGAERFVQEITTTAALQHPHILALFDSGTADGFLFYVMPFIEGETLRTRLDRESQLGVEVAVKIATEVADALDYAHRHGVIHRDIKPENILLHDGRPMVADFGIALAVSAAAGGRMTETGLSLGTPHYMSPEQATAEKEITGRSDVYSLASVLYEMLAGQPPHLGGSAQQIIMKIIAEPVEPVTRYRKSVPANVDAALATALEKLPADRFESPAQFSAALRNPSFHGTAISSVVRPGAKAPSRLTRAVVIVAGLVLAALAYVAGRQTAPGPEVFDVGLPDTAQLAFVDATPWGTEWPALTVSPDGDFIVYVARRERETELWYRSLRGPDARPLPGTRGGYQPAISPDGRVVGFIADRLLKKVAVDGSAPAVEVAEVVDPWGTAWTGPDEMLIASDFGNSSERIRMSDGARSHDGGPCAWPTLVPGTNDVVCHYSGQDQVDRIMPLSSDGSVPVSTTAGTILGDSARPIPSRASRIAGNHIVYVDHLGNLSAAPYDRATRKVGATSIMVAGLRRSSMGALGHFDLARTGDLVFVPGSNGGVGRFVAAEPGGATRVLPIPAKEHFNFGPSPDGTRIAVTSRGVEGEELWVYDVGTGQGDRVAVGSYLQYPVWAPDGSLAFQMAATAMSQPTTRVIAASGGVPMPIPGLELSPGAFPSPHTLVGNVLGDIAVVELDGTRVVRADTLHLPTQQYYPTVSPDRRWLAYSGSERGTSQLFVTPFPALDRQFKVSVDAASEPVWLPDGSLLHRVGSCWYRLRPRAGAIPPLSAPALSFCDDKFLNTPGLSNAAMPDGSVLYLRAVAPLTAGYVRVIRHWQRRLGT